MTQMEDNVLNKDRNKTISMPNHMAELGSGNFDQELTLSLLGSENDTLDQIEAAIERIEDGEGNVVFTSQHLTVCPDCPDPVAVPETTSVDAEPVAGGEEDAVDPELAGAGEADLDDLRIRPAPRVINKRNAFIMRTILQDVIRLGTGRRALALKRTDLAGKTGTTNDQRDTWFSGFNSTLAATSWVGFDSQLPLGFAVDPRVGTQHRLEIPRLGIYADSTETLGFKTMWANHLRRWNVQVG